MAPHYYFSHEVLSYRSVFTGAHFLGSPDLFILEVKGSESSIRCDLNQTKKFRDEEASLKYIIDRSLD